MKFIYFPLPALPATLEDRRRERPIAYRTERWQQMFDEVVELARMAEDLGFEAVTFPEHHLATEGLEIGSIPLLSLYVALHTKTIKVGPIGYVLPGWDPLRLAVEIGWLDQLTKGRTIVGMARGYQTRWLNQMGQFLHVGATVSDQSDVDQANRRPYEEGTPWPPTGWTTEFGDPGEVGKDGRLHKISVVPKPYQKPHPKIFQAFSISEATIRWCAKEDIVPMILMSHPDVLRGLVSAYVDSAAQAGRKLERGKSVGVLRQIYFGNSDEEVFRLSETGAVGLLWKRFWGHFGFWEAFKN